MSRSRERLTQPRFVGLAAVIWLLSACGGGAETARRDAYEAALADAERLHAAGADDDAAFGAFEALLAQAPDRDHAHLKHRQAAIRARQGRADDARALRHEAEAAAEAAGKPERGALAAFDRGVRQLKDARDPHEAERARLGLRALAESQPDTLGAQKAVAFLATHGLPDADRPQHATALAEWLDALADAHPGAAVAGTARWWLAHVHVFERGALADARLALCRLVTDAPDGPLMDDALFFLAALHERLGDWPAAAAAYEALWAARGERGFWVGTYRSALTAAAALRSGRIHLDARGDAETATARFVALLDAFATSRHRDDAWFELARARAAAGDAEGARAAATALLDERPDSRHAAAARRALSGEPLPPPDPARLRVALADPRLRRAP